MNKKRILLASTMAVLIAPSVLGNVSNQTTTVNAATDTTASENTIKNPIGTLDYGGAYAYDSNGNKLSLFLPGKSSWKLGQSVLINGQRYYGIGANEYVSSENITITDGLPPVLPVLAKPLDANSVGTLGYAVKVVDMYGNPTGRILPAKSAWKVSGLYVLKDGNSYYKVSPNEYVLATVVTLSTNTTNNQNNKPTTPTQKKVGTLSSETKVVDANGNPNGQTLPAGSSWQLGQLISIGGNGFYQVATNEYIPASSIKSGESIPSYPTNKTINLNSASIVLDDNGNQTNVTLPAGSSWHTDRYKMMNNYIYYRVGINQWVTNGQTEGNDAIFNNGPINITLSKNIQLYNSKTNSMTRTLTNGSSWKVFRTVKNSNGQVFAQVSTDEWLPVSKGSISDYTNGSIISGLTASATLDANFGTNASSSEKPDTNNPGIATPVTTVVNLYNASAVLDDNGNPTGKTMPAGSSWKADQSKTMHDYLYFRIAPNQWITNGGTNGSDHIFANGPFTITLAKDTQLYDNSTNSMTKTLVKGSSWKVFSTVINNQGQIFARISDNEWIPLSNGVIDDYAQGNSILNGLAYAATEEPDFATNLAK